MRGKPAQTQRLVPHLLELGQRHARYGVQPQFLGVMGRALLDALASVDEEWGHEVEAAWSQAYEHIAKVIAQGLGQAQVSESHSSTPRAHWEVPLVASQTQWAATSEGEVAYQRQGVAGIDLLICDEWRPTWNRACSFPPSPASTVSWRRSAACCALIVEAAACQAGPADCRRMMPWPISAR